ncbi:ubiquitin domain-containing protein [Cephalotus follicularis]|uniref:Ubiquitin domain-containing protein n=1 Tax=Cephalotus follicularis TaxID=3775 RepID=A0A1Q3C6U9_CEPFO|nr:ubiquitin domain-containing protein [Cephalotus follicularis]
MAATTVTLRIGGGEVIHEIETSLTHMLIHLKSLIEGQMGIALDRQTLWFNDEELRNDRTIESYGFEQHDTIKLVVEPLPGDPKVEVVVRSHIKEERIRVKETYTVGDLKRKIERRWGILSSYITLTRMSKEMEDDMPLSAYYVCEGSLVELVINREPR